LSNLCTIVEPKSKQHNDKKGMPTMPNYRTNLLLSAIFFLLSFENIHAQISKESIIRNIQNLNGQQRIDSLLGMIHTMADSYEIIDYEMYAESMTEINRLSDVKNTFQLNYLKGLAHNRLSQFDSALKYLQIASEITHKTIDAEMEANNTIMLADTYFRLGQSETAEKMLLALERKNREGTTSFTRAAISNNLAGIYNAVGNHESAMKRYLDAIDYFEQVKDYKQLGVIYSNLGTIHLHINQYARSRNYYQKALENSIKAGDIRQQASTLTNLGVIYNRLDSIDVALDYYQQSIYLIEKTGNLEDLARAYHNIAKLKTDRGRVEEGLADYLLSLDLSKKTKSFFGELYNHYSIGRIYHMLNKKDKALMHYDTVRQLLKTSKNDFLYVNILLAMQEIYAEKGQTDKAYATLKEVYFINDSMLRAETEIKVIDLQGKYDQAMEESRALALEKQILRQAGAIRLWIIIALIILLVFISILAKMAVSRKKMALEKQKADDALSRLQLELEYKQRELVNSAIQLAETQEKVSRFDEQLLELKNRMSESDAEVFAVLRKKLKQITPFSAFAEFEKRFDAVNEQFNAMLLARHPELSPSELRMCSLLKLGLSSKQIADLTHKTVRTVENNRSIIRKKLQLNNEDNLVTYLSAFNEVQMKAS
jgi:tetratricopeptide (TPR) repeat protein